MKAFVRKLAERRGVNESALIKQLLHEALGSPVPTQGLPVRPLECGMRDERVTVRLAAEDRRLLKERASARGLATSTYVAVLIRAHVQGRVPLPRAEYAALRQCILELTAIGRNLDEIVKIIDEGGKAPIPGRAELTAMLKVAEGLRDHFKELLKANEASWRSSAETSH